MPVNIERIAERGQQPLRHSIQHRGAARWGYENREFITAHSHHDIFVADHVTDARRGLRQHTIARRMAQRVVDGLEPIEIKIEDAEGLVCKQGEAQLAVDNRIQSLAIIKSRQRIGHRRVTQLPFSEAHREIGFLEPQKRSGQQGKASQTIDLRLRKFPRLGIDQAKGADHKTRLQLDRRTGIGTQFRAALHIGHETKIRMLRQVSDNHHIFPADDAGADRQVARAFRQLHSRLFGNMKPVLVNNMDRRPGHPEDPLPQLRQHLQFRHFGILERHDRPHSNQTLHFAVWP